MSNTENNGHQHVPKTDNKSKQYEISTTAVSLFSKSISLLAALLVRDCIMDFKKHYFEKGESFVSKMFMNIFFVFILIIIIHWLERPTN